MKRFFHFFAACALLLTIGVSSISAQAQAEIVVKHVKIGDLYYNLYDDGTACVTYDDLKVYSLSSVKNYVGLTEANIPSSVTYSGDGNTYKVTSIGNYAFEEAKDLKKVTIPSTVTQIGKGAFKNSAYRKDSKNWYDGVLYIGNYLIEIDDVKQLMVKEGTRVLADRCCEYNTSIEYLYLPNTVEYIGENAFTECENLETVVMSNKVKRIDDSAFFRCYELKSIDLPNTLEFIGKSAFDDCRSLTELTLPENKNYTTIEAGTFSGCSKLTKIVLPKQITMIGNYAMYDCTSLKYIYCNGNPKNKVADAFSGVDVSQITVYFQERHKAFYEEHWKGFNLVPLRFTEGGIYYELNDSKKTAIVVPERDDADNYKSLSGSILIDKIVIADGEKFTINGMAQGAFKFSKIGRITIDAAMNEIPADAFVYNTNLTDAVLPNSVTSIGERAFSGCTSLELVPGLTNDQKDFLPNVDKIGESAFSGCVKLPKLRLLTETEIGEWAFSGCKGVKDIVLGADVKTIGANAFSECSGLESLTIYSTTQLPFTANMITGVDKGKFVVYVQAKDVAKYKAADGWKEFTIKPIGGEKQYTVIVDVNDSEGGTVTGIGTYYEGETYTLTAIPNEGWHFVRWGNGSTMNPVSGTISNDVRTTAFFGPDAKFYDIQVLSSDEKMGTVSGGGTHIEEGQSVSITATPKEGCEFLYWVDSKGVYWGKQTEWKVTQDETLTAHFRVIPDYDEYMVFVLGERVTSANAGDILGDGVWSYDRETHTLRTMKDATYKKENKEFIQDWETGLGALTVVVNHHITAEVETTDKVIRFALYGYNGIKFVGSKFSSVNLTALNMIAAQTMKTLEVSNHLRLFITQGNTTDFGKSQFSTSMIFSGTPAIRVNSASLRLSVNLGNKISNQTNDKIELTNAEINYGELNGQYMEILDLTPMYMVNYQTEAAMYLCLVSGMGSFYEGEQVTLYPHPEEGYEFVKWSNGVTDNPYTFTMPAEDVLIDPIVQGKDITPDGAFVNAYAPVGQGTIKDFEGGWYAAGTELSIYAEPFDDWHFVRWDDGNTDNPRIFTVEAGKSMSITAEFEQTPRYTVTFLDWDDEVLKQEKVIEGEDATAPEDPYREGYTFMGWKPADFTDIHSNLTVHAQYEKEEFVFECGDHLLGVLTDNVLTITGYGDMWDWNFNGTPWFYAKNDITSVQLPDGLTSIGNYAFDGCESLTSIDIPAGVTNIGFAAFSKCYSLTSIDIPAGVTDIKKQTFYNCYNLTSVNLPAGVTDIGNAAFYGCNSLTSINIPEGVTGIGNNAFTSCGLTSIDIPASVTGIGDYAFSYCVSLNSVTCRAAEPPVLGDDVFGNIDRENIPLYVPKASIDKYKAAEQWKEFRIEATSNMCGDNLLWEIKDGVLTITGYGDMWNWDDIKNYAPWFDYQEEITSVQLPDGLTSIGDYAFYSCISLGSITIPAGVTSIGTLAFACDALKTINVAAENEHFSDIDGVLFNKSKTILLQYPEGKTEESYTVPDGVTEIGEGAFYLSWVKNIHLPEGVTVIGASAFSGSGLSTIDLPSTLTYIGEGAFYRIPLMTIDIPEGVTSIEEATFAECMLQSIHLPASLTSIGEFAFYSCAHMESIDIPAAVTSIDENAFQNCYGLKSVTCRAPEPPTLGEDVFYLVDCPKTPLYVPLAALDKYKSADQWKEFNPIESYEFAVTFLDKDGNLIEEQYVFEGEDAVAPEAPAVEGYTFTGWDKDFSAVKEDMVITAQYAINTFTVRFYDHSDNVISTQTVNWNEAALEPELADWEGHTFTSWSAEFDHVKSDLDIKPIYDVEVYKVTFLGFNDAELTVENVEYGKNATAPDAPDVEGYTFTGWDKEFDNVTSDLTVKAKYEINYYALTLVAGHGTIAITDESGEHSLNPDMVMHGTIVKLIVTADDGYLFKGWSDSNTDNPRYVTVTEDKTFTALFEKEPDDPTGVEEVESQKSKVESAKLLRDGVLYILREGKMYNAQGQKVQ